MTLTNIKTVVDKAGKARRYFRVKGCKLVPLPDLPTDHPDFLAAWAEAMSRAKGRAAPHGAPMGYGCGCQIAGGRDPRRLRPYRGSGRLHGWRDVAGCLRP